jgi:methylated-DNA-protein-cysteine methyltransferase-like protein
MTPPASPPDRLDFDLAVWDVVARIPRGRVTTYGWVARAIPTPHGVLETTYAAFGPRWVGSAMARCPDDVPWHRVVNSRGEVSVRSGGGGEEQWARLKREGVVPGANGRIDLRAHGWDPSASGPVST